jgi:hypothetical protein
MKLYMVIRISIFGFLQNLKLTQVENFPPSFDLGATVDHYNVLKFYFLVRNLIVESNILSKSGLGIEMGQFYT